MEPTTINGIPAHPLLAHFVVVLIPLTALAVALAVLWPAARRRLGIVTPLLALATAALIPLTTEAGEWLEERVGETPLVETHAELGDQMLLWFAPVVVLSVAWWLLTTPAATRRLGGRFATSTAAKALTAVVAVLALTAAGAATWQVYRVGDTGAQSVWQGTVPAAGDPR